MKICYFPGCTLKNQAKDLDNYARKAAEVLDVQMEEIPEWQCCGGVYTMAHNEAASKLPSIRVLDYAKHNGGYLLTLCSACHNVVKRVNNDMVENQELNQRVNNYMALEEPYNGEAKVIHYLELLRDLVGFDKVKAAVKNPINKKVAAYYGCLLLRPSKVMAFDNPENPTIIENLIKAIGGTPVISALRNECCGAYVSVKDKDLARNKSEMIIANAKDAGAEIIITACPLCYYNLKRHNTTDVEIVYFTELLAKALGVNE